MLDFGVYRPLVVWHFLGGSCLRAERESLPRGAACWPLSDAKRNSFRKPTTLLANGTHTQDLADADMVNDGPS